MSNPRFRVSPVFSIVDRSDEDDNMAPPFLVEEPPLGDGVRRKLPDFPKGDDVTDVKVLAVAGQFRAAFVVSEVDDSSLCAELKAEVPPEDDASLYLFLPRPGSKSSKPAFALGKADVYDDMFGLRKVTDLCVAGGAVYLGGRTDAGPTMVMIDGSDALPWNSFVVTRKGNFEWSAGNRDRIIAIIKDGEVYKVFEKSVDGLRFKDLKLDELGATKVFSSNERLFLGCEDGEVRELKFEAGQAVTMVVGQALDDENFAIIASNNASVFGVFLTKDGTEYSTRVLAPN